MCTFSMNSCTIITFSLWRDVLLPISVNQKEERFLYRFIVIFLYPRIDWVCEKLLGAVYLSHPPCNFILKDINLSLSYWGDIVKCCSPSAVCICFQCIKGYKTTFILFLVAILYNRNVWLQDPCASPTMRYKINFSRTFF